MPPYTIFMLLFSVAILLYAALMAITKDYKMLPYRATNSVKPKNPKKYMLQLSKAVALTGLVPGLAGIVMMWNGMLGFGVFIVGLIVTLWLSTKIVKDVI